MNNTNFLYLLLLAISFVLTIIIHFRVIESLSKEDKMVKFGCINIVTTLILLIIYKSDKDLAIVLFLPYIYLVNAFFFRILFSNFMFRIIKIKFLKLPPNPTLVYSLGYFGLSWKNEKKYKPQAIEYIYSIVTFIFPFYEFSFFYKLIV